MNPAPHKASNERDAQSTLIQALGDLCHEKYTGCQKTDRPINEWDYCYTDEVVNMLDTPEAKKLIEDYARQELQSIVDTAPKDPTTRNDKYYFDIGYAATKRIAELSSVTTNQQGEE